MRQIIKNIKIKIKKLGGGQIFFLESLKYFFHPAPKGLPPHLNSTPGKGKHLVGDLPIVDFPLWSVAPIVVDRWRVHTSFLMSGICLKKEGHLHLAKSSSVLVSVLNWLHPYFWGFYSFQNSWWNLILKVTVLGGVAFGM